MNTQSKNYKKGRPNGTNKKYNKKKKGFTKDKEFTNESLKEGAFESSRNDWRWYATNAQLVKDAASYPYTYAMGSKLNLGPYGAKVNNLSIPGVAALQFVPTVGWSDHPNSPINVASRSIYSDIRHTNSGAANYDPVDLMIYLVGMDSCYMALEFMKRAYGVMRLVSPVNRYLPKAIITAMGIDFDDLNANLDDFRAAINTYAQKLKALVIPNGMSYMAKHQWLVSGLYQDNMSDKSQTYLFVPSVFFAFDLDEDGAGMLKSKSWQISTEHTFQDCVNFMNTLLDPLLANQDFSIISGDILKWRGEGGVVVPSGITETYQVFPTFDESVLDQIQNATALGYVQPSNATTGAFYSGVGRALEVRQDPSKRYLVSTPWFRHPYRWTSNWANPGRNAYMVKRFLNFTHEGVTPEETMEASRLCNIATAVEESADEYDWFKVTTLGSEALVNVVYFYYAVDETSGDWTLHRTSSAISLVDLQRFDATTVTQSDIQALAKATEDTLLKIQVISAFYRHPFYALTTGIIDTTNTLEPRYGTFQGYMTDINFYSIVDVQDLEQMSEVALMSQFNVRMQG